MFIRLLRIRVLERRIKRLESDIAFEDGQMDIAGIMTGSYVKMVKRLNHLKEKLVDLQSTGYVPSSLS